MAHISLYVADDLAARLKRGPPPGHVALPYILSQVSSHRESAWPPAYFKTVCGFLRESLAEPADRLPEPVDVAEARG